MLLTKLINIQRISVRRSSGRLKLTGLLGSNSEIKFPFQQSCWLCRVPGESGLVNKNDKIKRVGDSQIFTNNAYRLGIFRGFPGYCTSSSSSNTNESPQNERENVYTIPNALCIVRIGLTPFIANFIVHSQFGIAIGLLTIAGITDLLDGWIARVVPGQSSVMGSFLDPMADKILVGTMFLSLTYMDLIPVLLTTLIVGRDAILIATGFYIRYQSLDPPRTLGRYFNVSLPTAQLAPTFISKVNTGLQLCVVGATLASTVISSLDLHPYLQILWFTTGATTVGTAIHYCFAKDTVKLLRNFKAKNRKT